MPTTTKYRSQIEDSTRKTYYLTFPFGTRREIGVDILNMGTRWVEITARSRAKALELAAARFGHEGWQLNGADGFPETRRQFYPDGCCLIIPDL